MKNWSNLFNSSTKSGIYTVALSQELPGIEQSAMVSGLHFIYIDLSGIQTKDEFLQVISRALQFPDYFGMNWDAFEECLRDMSWLGSNGYVVVLDNFEEFGHKVPKAMKMAKSIFRSAAEFWKQQDIPFFVVLVRNGYESWVTKIAGKK